MDIEQLTRAVVSSVRSEMKDLTPRQLALLLLVNSDVKTVRDLAATMNCGKPAITRNATTLAKYGFITRKSVAKDARDVHLVITEAGSDYLAAYVALMAPDAPALKLVA